jgi:hypothetical protein
MRTWAQQKAGLTRAINSKVYDKVVAECKRTIAEWEGLTYGWPDDWSRWQRALDDAWWEARSQYLDGKIRREDLPEQQVSLDDLRWQVHHEQTEREHQQRGELLKQHLHG